MILRSTIPLALACALLSGCVTVFPPAEPSALYKLAITPRGAGSAGIPVKLNILRAPTDFPRVSANDQILTISGGEAASIAGARWAAPAQIMFDEQIVTAFDSSNRVRLLTRGGAAAPDGSLRVEVRTFEARYAEPRPIVAAKSKDSKASKAKDFDPRGAPTVVVELKATVAWPANPAATNEFFFRAEAPASENRVSAIVTAYDAATTQVLDKLVGWVEGLPPPPKPVPPVVSQR